MAKDVSKATTEIVSAGEKTKSQIGTSSISLMIDDVHLPGSFSTYRQMIKNPTIDLARTISNAPIKTGNYVVERQNDVTDVIFEFIEEQIKALWPTLISDIIWARDWGYMAFEKVWDIADGHYIYKKLKPLRPDDVRVLLDKDHGVFLGVKQGDITLTPPHTFWFKYRAEPGGWYGRSQHESIRDPIYTTWLDTLQKLRQYSGKIAGVLPIIHYPVGESRDANGTTQTNFDIAKAMLENLGRGKGVAIPLELVSWAEDALRNGMKIDIASLMSWQIDFLEPNGDHADGFLKTIRHMETEMMRGWLLPERVATEGQFGTKAEAETHSNTALVVADLIFAEILQAVNWYIINPLLTLNFGSELANAVYLSPSGLTIGQKSFYQKIVESILTDAGNIELVKATVDMNQMLEAVNVPLRADVGDWQDIPSNVNINPSLTPNIAAMLNSWQITS